jgi:hypothetical protein
MVVLRSEAASVLVAPQLGGRIVEVVDHRVGRQWLWRNHRTPIGPVAPDSVYDEVWQGGFEELFPNDAATFLDDGSAYPDHGELWSVPWDVRDSTNTAVELGVRGRATDVEITKRISLIDSEVTIRYRLRHDGLDRLHHLFKLHAAMHVDESCTIDLPGGVVEKVDSGFGSIVPTSELFEWPGADDVAIDRCHPAQSREFEFVYVAELPEGWCGITDQRSGARISIEYPQDVFPYCWLFITYGGWRGHNVVVLEPCTNHPKDLREAMARGTSAVLEVGEEREFEVRLAMELTDG